MICWGSFFAGMGALALVVVLVGLWLERRSPPAWEHEGPD